MAEGLSRVPPTRWTSGTDSDAQDETGCRLVCGPGPGFGSSSPTPPRSAWQPGLTANSLPGSVSPLSAVPSNSPPLPPTVGYAVPGAQCPSARGSSVPGFRGPAKATTPAALPWSTSRSDTLSCLVHPAHAIAPPYTGRANQRPIRLLLTSGRRMATRAPLPTFPVRATSAPSRDRTRRRTG
ncbi:hypothetical protein BD309DRAFT_1014011 [Dichomitus squalens]|uniref:Uncharacterized protein n=1 Tax=Dichomitus squalens TaxID=114155 RepID=A0A4Q9Q8H7_9APHY|nr:hypothetical protein BD309DRAFT_1014011 [Dichomitus squalens]TBU62904.1 hypothetical protein BD310DRAFT_973903 [Dichomitus squalens]